MNLERYSLGPLKWYDSEALPCVTRLRVNRGVGLSVSPANHLSQIRKRVKLLKVWKLLAYSLTRYIMRRRDLEKSRIGKVLWYDSTSLGNWHLMLGAATSYHLEAKCSWGKLDSEPRRDTWKSNSNCVHVLVVLQGHTLKGKETTRIGSKWTLGYGMFGPQVLSPYKKAIYKWSGREKFPTLAATHSHS
jgi:hypothetical protein